MNEFLTNAFDKRLQIRAQEKYTIRNWFMQLTKSLWVTSEFDGPECVCPIFQGLILYSTCALQLQALNAYSHAQR